MLPKKRVGRRRGWAILIGLLVFFNITQAQGVIVSGIVTDSSTNAPLSNVSVYFKGASGVRTDSAGTYFLQADRAAVYIEFSIVGYKKLRIPISQDTGRLEISVKLRPLYNELTGVTVTKKNKARYTNKNNPAVDLIRQVIDHKAENRMEGFASSSSTALCS